MSHLFPHFSPLAHPSPTPTVSPCIFHAYNSSVYLSWLHCDFSLEKLISELSLPPRMPRQVHGYKLFHLF